ncbi:MAG: type II secretion system minor pseudopilin GspI [Geobacteraceae bacterium]|nr:type II secretion system minor pseudopilin GspI [Geobacteraceae bacterium]
MKGFTLLEVMVALAIMAGVVLTVISSVNYHLSLTAQNNEETVALLLARAKLEELELLGKEELAQVKEGTFQPEWPDYSWKAEISTAPVPIFKSLTVTVTWGADRRNLSLEHYLLQAK